MIYILFVSTMNFTLFDNFNATSVTDYELRPYDVFISSVVNELFRLQTFIFENKIYFIYFVLLFLALVCFWIIFTVIILISHFVKEMENSKWFVHESCKVKKAILIKLVCKAKNAADRIS